MDDANGALPNIHVQRIVALPYLTGDQPSTRRDDYIPPIGQLGGLQQVSNNTIPSQNENNTDRQSINGMTSSFGSLPTINDFKYVKNTGQGKKKKHSKDSEKPPSKREGDRKREPNTPATPMKSTRGQNGGNSMYTSIVMGDSTNYHVNNNQFSGSRLPSRGSPSEQLFTFTNKGKMIGSKRHVTKII